MLQGGRGQLRSALLGHYEMMENGEYCDFRIIVENCEFPVHKVILASRSPYFRTLFSTNMAESNENLLKLDDIELDTFRVLLKYVYTCEVVSPSNEVALKLIMHGEKYGIKDLVNLCEDYLLNNIDNKIAARCLLAGELLERKELKSHALSLLRRNWEVAFSTDGWNDVILNHSLMTEIEKIECCSERKHIEGSVGRTITGEVTWTIRNLSVLGSHGWLESPAFSLLGDDDLSWRFRISKCGTSYTVELSHFGPPVIIPVSCNFAVCNNRGGKAGLFTGTIDTSCCFLRNSNCNMVLATLSMMESMHLDRDIIYVTLKKSEKTPATSSMDYLSEYLENSCFTDAVIKVGGEEFSVHKIILSAASPVFLENFRSQGSFFELNDHMGPDTFRKLLLIIYQSQEVPDEVNFDLLEAAKRFKLSNKQINRCRAAVFRAMKDSHLIDFLIQADAQEDHIMKRMAFKQMANNFDAVVQLDEWSQMSKHSSIHDEFFKFILSSRKIHA